MNLIKISLRSFGPEQAFGTTVRSGTTFWPIFWDGVTFDSVKVKNIHF